MLILGGCVATGDPAATPAASTTAPPPAAFATERLVGSWGVASYHVDTDRARTEAQARSGCSQPYVITKGPTDGVVMHVADDPKPYELRLKSAPDGRVYLGFEAPPGHRQDREILSSSDTTITMRFVDPNVNRRYGTFIFVRCA